MKKSKLYWIVFRSLLVLIITIYINFWIFPNVTINSNELDRIEISNITYLQIPDTISKKEISAGNLDAVIWKILYFKSKSDRVCFENFGTYIDYGVKNDFKNVEVGVIYNKEKFKVKDKVCKIFDKNMDKFTFNWYFDSHLIVPPGVIENQGQFWIRPRVKTYLESGGIITHTAKFIFIFLSVGALIWSWGRGLHGIIKGFVKK